MVFTTTIHLKVRVAVCGNVDAGKSTCVGCLAKHKLDDGRGSLRSAVMRFPHEVKWFH
jgi:elongation factor 1-alpha